VAVAVAGQVAGIKFRPEIEGLRGLLVLLVMVFHAGVPSFEGVYFAVDIFFVVSGYLMALIIQSDISVSRFSIIGFYERRVRRIFPALYVVLISSLVCAYYLMPAPEYEGMGESALWILGLAGNVYFSASTYSYFDADMGLQPFMHLWTLGLEQQYYLIIPLCFAFCLRVAPRLNINTLLIGMTILSFGCALLIVYEDAQKAFYIPFSRMWEFSLGSLLALNEARLRAWVPTKWHRWLADAGVVAVILVFCTATMHWVHPGPLTLIPVFGGLLYLGFTSEKSFLSRFLCLKPLLQLGAISYSLYLWHQVFFALARWYSINTLTGLDYFALAVAAMLLSVVSYHLVEVPFRNRKKFKPVMFWSVLVLATIPLYYTAKYIDKKHGVQERLPVAAQEAYRDKNSKSIAVTADDVACYATMKDGPCPIGDPQKPRRWMLVGDSHAAALTTSLDLAFRENGKAGYAIFRNACALAIGSRLADDTDDACEAHNRQLIERLSHSDVEGIILIGRYPYFLDHAPYDNGEGGIEAGRQFWFEPTATRVDREAAVIESFLAPVEKLLALGKRVVVVYPVPEMGWNVPHYQFKAMLHQARPPGISISLVRYRERSASIRQAFDELGERPGLVRVRPSQLLCDIEKGRCLAQRKDGRLLYMDDDHVNNLGADILVSDIMRKAFADDSLTDRIVTRF
jgi:peptidoglycan/LPS O-acetylase OafA/YrhL